RLASGAAVASPEIKKSVKRALGYTLEQPLKHEIEAQERCWNTRDAREGFAAFLAKREPRFEGRLPLESHSQEGGFSRDTRDHDGPRGRDARHLPRRERHRDLRAERSAREHL